MYVMSWMRPNLKRFTTVRHCYAWFPKIRQLFFTLLLFHFRLLLVSWIVVRRKRLRLILHWTVDTMITFLMKVSWRWRLLQRRLLLPGTNLFQRRSFVWPGHHLSTAGGNYYEPAGDCGLAQ